MTIEELEIIIKANISDAMDGIKQITNEVKQAVSKSVEPMKQLTNQAKTMASQSASSVSQAKTQMKDFAGGIGSTAKQQEYLNSKIQEMQDLLSQADMGMEVGDTMKIESDIERLRNRLAKLQEKEIKPKVDVDTQEAEPKVNSLWSNIKTFCTNFVNGCKGAGKLAGKGLVAMFKTGVKGFAGAVKGIASGIKGIVSKSKDAGSKISGSFSKGIKSIKSFALGLLSVRTAVSLVSKAMQSYLSYDTQLNDSLQNCWNVLGSLLAPILEVIINLFSKAVSYVNAFVQALTGINLVARANTKALKSQSSATQSANKQLSGLDDLNNLSSDSGSSGSGSSNPITVDSVNLDDLKNKFLNTDWVALGVSIGEKINSALSSIDWKFIQSWAVTLGKDLANLFNGLVDGIDWDLLGTTIGNGIQTALLFAYTFMSTFDFERFGSSIAESLNGVMDSVDFTLLGQTLASKWVALVDTLYGFVTTFDWSKFGTSIGEAVMGWWNSIDWSKVAETISKGIRGLLESVKTFLLEIDFEQIGEDLWTLISEIDWSGMISDLAYILGQAIAGIGQFLWGFIKDAVAEIGDFFGDEIEECGGDVIAGLFKGIIDALAGIGQWLYDNICVPFVDGFKSMFGIHSPSTVMAEIGTYLIEGLKNGLSNIWDKIKEIFENLKTSISEKFTEILNKIKEVFSIDNIKSHFNNVVSSIKNVFSSIPDWFKDTFSKAWQKVKDVFSSGGKIFSGIKEGIENTFKSVVNKLISGINTIIAIPFNKINSMLNKIRSISILGASPFKGLWSNNPLSVPKIPSLASGGVLDEETLVRVAEYSNAKSNPEIISPRDMMKDVMKEALEESETSGTRIDRLTLKILDKTFYDDAIDYINEKSRIKGVSVIKGV